jgi:hypothetical protein
MIFRNKIFHESKDEELSYEEKLKFTIYTLELENNKYYVGKSCVP